MQLASMQHGGVRSRVHTYVHPGRALWPCILAALGVSIQYAAGDARASGKDPYNVNDEKVQNQIRVDTATPIAIVQI